MLFRIDFSDMRPSPIVYSTAECLPQSSSAKITFNNHHQPYKKVTTYRVINISIWSLKIINEQQ